MAAQPAQFARTRFTTRSRCTPGRRYLLSCIGRNWTDSIFPNPFPRQALVRSTCGAVTERDTPAGPAEAGGPSDRNSPSRASRPVRVARTASTVPPFCSRSALTLSWLCGETLFSSRGPKVASEEHCRRMRKISTDLDVLSHDKGTMQLEGILLTSQLGFNRSSFILTRAHA